MKKLALIIALIGIFLLLFFINNTEPKEIQISEISEKNLNERVLIKGITSNIKVHAGNFTTFKINNFPANCNCPKLKENQKIEAIGQITQYQETFQITIDKIKSP